MFGLYGEALYAQWWYWVILWAIVYFYFFVFCGISLALAGLGGMNFGCGFLAILVGLGATALAVFAPNQGTMEGFWVLMFGLISFGVGGTAAVIMPLMELVARVRGTFDPHWRDVDF